MLCLNAFMSVALGICSRIKEKKDEFESDMDDDLDQQLVAHASRFMTSISQVSAAQGLYFFCFLLFCFFFAFLLFLLFSSFLLFIASLCGLIV